jgi:inosose dehydratase
MNRCHFLQTSGLAAAVLAARLKAAETEAPKTPHIACNEYAWHTFDRRENKDFREDLADSVARVAAAGLDGFEPLADSPEFLRRLVPLLKGHGLAMRSVYVNSALHERDRIERNIGEVLAIAEAAKKLADTQIVVTNPSPIRWGGLEDKSDEQLRVQAETLGRLGAKLNDQGLTLAYHNHGAELRQAACELHHMLLATDPGHVSFCLDAEWVHSGAGR